LFAFGVLTKQIWQHGAVTVAAWREFHRPDVRLSRVHGQMHLAPLASALNALLSGLPLAITDELDPCAVHQQVQGALGPPIQDLDDERLLLAAQSCVVGHGPVQVCHLQQAGEHSGRLPQRQFEQTLIVRQNWIAASENTEGRPGLPSGGASHVLSWSSQIRSDLHSRSEAV
jgi:hypothetical protein